MFQKFGDYLFYLLNAPLKKDKPRNQFYLFFAVIGRIFDGMKQDIFKFRRQKYISTQDTALLELSGQDRDMFRMRQESVERFRRRLQMKAIIAELAGSEQGILLAIASMGFQAAIEPLWKTDPSRWAEIIIDIMVSEEEGLLLDYDCILTEVMKVKQASTLPHIRFTYKTSVSEKVIAVGGICSCIKVQAYIPDSISATGELQTVSALYMATQLQVRAGG